MPTIIVCAAIVHRNGRFLVTRRPQGVHLEGYWEFPGGKCETDEPHSTCLRRELKEELDVDAVVGPEILTTSHTYPERTVELHFLRCDLMAEPSPQLGQDLMWASRDELTTLRFPPADAEVIRLLIDERRTA
jgi:8-oxo-dGTP diphosphatase